MIRTVPPQATRLGETLISFTLAGTTSRAGPESVGSVVGEPAYSTSISRPGPGASRALHPPSDLVRTTATCVKRFEPLFAAVSTCTT